MSLRSVLLALLPALSHIFILLRSPLLVTANTASQRTCSGPKQPWHDPDYKFQYPTCANPQYKANTLWELPQPEEWLGKPNNPDFVNALTNVLQNPEPCDWDELAREVGRGWDPEIVQQAIHMLKTAHAAVQESRQPRDRTEERAYKRRMGVKDFLSGRRRERYCRRKGMEK